jgi:hypothetical protein
VQAGPRDTPSGVERELLVRKAHRTETASHTTGWLPSGYKHQGRFK